MASRARARLGRARAVHRLRLRTRARRWPTSSAARRWRPTRELAAARRRRRPLPTSRRSSREVAARGRAARQGGRLDARRARRWPTSRAAYPGVPVFRVDAEHARSRSRQGVARLRRAGRAGRRRRCDAAVRDRFARVGTVVRRARAADGRRRRACAASARPTVALVVEAQVDAGVRARHARRRWPPSSSSRRWPAPPRCCARAATTRSRCAARSPRPAARPPAAWPRSSAAACARRFATPWTPSLERVIVIAAPPTRDEIADFLGALVSVYTIIIIA